MLFSNETIANYINANFEPVWESVRPVPIVKIDFGNGNEITRTLHGNIATYVCNTDGVVVDVLPGMYEPNAYMQQLNTLRAQTQNVSEQADLPKALQNYHLAQLNTLRQRRFGSRMRDMSKGPVEMPLKQIMSQPITTAPAQVAPFLKEEYPGINMHSDVVTELMQDTKINETERRSEIHRMLASSGPVRPTDLTKWLYKNVLHVDLDDPLLGLGPTLFSTYPFKDDPRIANGAM